MLGMTLIGNDGAAPVMPVAPPISAPGRVRAGLADLWRLICLTRGGWDSPAQAEYERIRALPRRTEGPQGWATQAGFLDLAYRAEKIQTIPRTDPRVVGFAAVVALWRSQMANQWNTAGITERASIRRAWLAAEAEDRVAEAQRWAQKNAGRLSGGAVIGAVLVGAAALVAVRPDLAAGVAARSIGYARDAIKERSR